jgi:hypothetical protein
MALKDDFSHEEWTHLQEGPFVAGVLVILASPNIMGIPKESIAMVKAAENVGAAGAASDLATLLVADIDDMDEQATFDGAGSRDEVISGLLDKLGDVLALVDERFDADVAAGYRQWVAGVARATAEASKEGSFLGIGGTRVTKEEHAMIEAIDAILRP